MNQQHGPSIAANQHGDTWGWSQQCNLAKRVFIVAEHLSIYCGYLVGSFNHLKKILVNGKDDIPF